MPPGRPLLRSIPLFKVGPIQIAVHPSWLFTFAALVIIARSEIVGSFVRRGSALEIPAAVGVALLFYVFILIHELSHAVVARAHGLDATRITLFVFGGVAQIGSEAQKPSAEFQIAIAGPLASLVLAGVLAAVARNLHPGHSGLAGVWGFLAVINIVLTVFNLIPAFPLDGGRLLRAGLWASLRDRVIATRWASNAGKGFACLLMGAGGAYAAAFIVSQNAGNAWPGLWYIVLGYFLYSVADGAGRVEGGPEPRTSALAAAALMPGRELMLTDVELERFKGSGVIVESHEGQAAQPDPSDRGPRPDERARVAAAAPDKPRDRARDPRGRPANQGGAAGRSGRARNTAGDKRRSTAKRPARPAGKVPPVRRAGKGRGSAR
jgi:Zn-dependent protease